MTDDQDVEGFVDEVADGMQGPAETETALVRAEPLLGGGALLSPEDLEEAVRRRNAMKAVIVKFTKRRHWDRFGDNLRLNRHGAESLAQMGGISVGPSGRPWREPERGYDLDSDGDPYYLWNYPYQAIHEGRAFAYVGVCSSKDKFFGTGAQGREFEKVDETQIKRKAQANAIVNCVGRFIDVGAIPAEEFKEITGYDPPEKIRFQEGGYKGRTTPAKKGAKRVSGERAGAAAKARKKPAAPRPASGGEQAKGADRNVTPTEGPPPEEDLSTLDWSELLAKALREMARVEVEYQVAAWDEFFYSTKSKESLTPAALSAWGDDRWGETANRRRWVEGAVGRAMKKYPSTQEAPADEPAEGGQMTDKDIPF